MSAFEILTAGAERWRQLDPSKSIEQHRLTIRKMCPDLAEREREEGGQVLSRLDTTKAIPLFKAGSAAAEIDAKAAELRKSNGRLTREAARVQIRKDNRALAERERDEERQAA